MNHYRVSLAKIRKERWLRVFWCVCACWHWTTFLPGLWGRWKALSHVLGKFEHYISVWEKTSPEAYKTEYSIVRRTNDDYREQTLVPFMATDGLMVDTRTYASREQCWRFLGYI